MLKQSIGFYQWMNHARLEKNTKTLTNSKVFKINHVFSFNSLGLVLWIKYHKSGCTPGCKHTRLSVCCCSHHHCFLCYSFDKIKNILRAGAKKRCEQSDSPSSRVWCYTVNIPPLHRLTTADLNTLWKTENKLRF